MINSYDIHAPHVLTELRSYGIVVTINAREGESVYLPSAKDFLVYYHDFSCTIIYCLVSKKLWQQTQASKSEPRLRRQSAKTVASAIARINAFLICDVAGRQWR